jgi:putative FmdB family regulatory protein
MPIYEFRCLGCVTCFRTAETQKREPWIDMKCPKCGFEEVEKILSTVSITKTGSGKQRAPPELRRRYLLISRFQVRKR